MTSKKQVPEIAREALIQLNVRKLAPTPANFQACYNEIARLPNSAGFPEASLRQISLALKAKTPEQRAQLELLDAAIGQRNWNKVQEALVAFACGNDPDEMVQEQVTPELGNKWLANLAGTIEKVLPALGREDTQLLKLATELLCAFRHPPEDFSQVESLFASFCQHASIAAENQAEIKAMLISLLQLAMESIGELSVDDKWLKTQIEALLIAVKPPLTLRRLDDVERQIRTVMASQVQTKARSIQAQAEMRAMLVAFIEQLAVMNKTSDVFQEKIENSARQMEQVKSIEEMAPLLGEVIEATRTMAADTRHAHGGLQSLQEKVLATEAEICQLRQDLDQASALARHDPLTDALNSKGLDEALAKEIASMRRSDKPLCVAMLDIDNFKMLNDRLGHESGDVALIHLVTVAKESLRPTDYLARYGGEEFVILMPDTPLEQGIQAMKRMQRRLTKTFFFAGSEKTLITFSAGVAEVVRGESGAKAVNRADQAMYLAKRAGKNRVLGC